MPQRSKIFNLPQAEQEALNAEIRRRGYAEIGRASCRERV